MNVSQQLRNGVMEGLGHGLNSLSFEGLGALSSCGDY